MWGQGVTFDHDEFIAAQNEEFDREEFQAYTAPDDEYPDVSGGGVPFPPSDEFDGCDLLDVEDRWNSPDTNDNIEWADESEWMDEPDDDTRERAHDDVLDADERDGIQR